jgi:ubiquitin C-terminal hydrolase
VNDDDNLDNRGEEKLKKQLSNEGEGKSKEDDKKTPGDDPGEGVSTKYRLRGIVVHSGQASGGHYYSFIQIRCDRF